MKFSVSAAIFALAATVAAAPQPAGHDGPRFPVPGDMTVKQAQTKCGDDTKLSCCNKASYSGDSSTDNSGLLSGVLGNLIGASGSGSQGLGLFQQCSDLNVIGDLLNQKCKQNVACCQNSSSPAVSILSASQTKHFANRQQEGNLVGVGLPCVALGSLL